MLQCSSTVSGVNTTLQPPPTVDVLFEEKSLHPSLEGLYSVNVSWTHPIGNNCLFNIVGKL